MVDGVELMRYNSNPLIADSDGDGCSDGREIASINLDRAVNVIDLLMVAISYGPASHPNYVPAFDYNGDRTINSLDLAFVAPKYGTCPAPVAP